MPTSIYSVAFPQTKAENTKTKGENNHPLQVPNQKRNELLYLIKFISMSCLTYRRLGLSISFFLWVNYNRNSMFAMVVIKDLY